jgi:hypothetical protein
MVGHDGGRDDFGQELFYMLGLPVCLIIVTLVVLWCL